MLSRCPLARRSRRQEAMIGTVTLQIRRLNDFYRLGKPGSQTFLPNFLIGSSQSTPTVTRSLQSAVSPKSQNTPGTPGSRSESQVSNILSFLIHPFLKLAKPRLPDRTEVKSFGPPVASLNALFSPSSPTAHNKSVGGNASMIISDDQNQSFTSTAQNGVPKV